MTLIQIEPDSAKVFGAFHSVGYTVNNDKIRCLSDFGSGKVFMKTWTQEQAVAFESARECITDMMALKSAEIADEEEKTAPNDAKINALENDLAKLARERTDLSLHDSEQVERIRKEYGAKVRAYRQSHQRRAA